MTRTQPIYPPHVNRYVDNVAVLVPRFYPDPGPPGYYPELQSPVQTRLDIRWNEKLGRQTYVQLNSVFITGVDRSLKKRDVIRLFEDISTQVKIKLFKDHAIYKEVKIVILEFPTARQAEEAIMFVLSHRRLFGRYAVHARYNDINANGPNTGSTRDILLVREDFALTPSYTPISGDGSTDSPHKPDVKQWNATGFSRDSFRLKRPHEHDHWSPARKRSQPDWDYYPITKRYSPSLPAIELMRHEPSMRRQASKVTAGPLTPVSNRFVKSDEPDPKRKRNGGDAPSSIPATIMCPLPLLPRIDAAGPPMCDTQSARSSSNDLERLLEQSLALVGRQSDPIHNHGHRAEAHKKTKTDPNSTRGDRDREREHYKKIKYSGISISKSKHASKSSKHFKYDRTETRFMKPRYLSSSDRSPRHHYDHRHDSHVSAANRAPWVIPDPLGTAGNSPTLTTNALNRFRPHFALGSAAVRAQTPEPRYIAMSHGGDELIIASTKEAAESAFDRAKPCLGGPVEHSLVRVEDSEEEEEPTLCTFELQESLRAAEPFTSVDDKKGLLVELGDSEEDEEIESTREPIVSVKAKETPGHVELDVDFDSKSISDRPWAQIGDGASITSQTFGQSLGENDLVNWLKRIAGQGQIGLEASMPDGRARAGNGVDTTDAVGIDKDDASTKSTVQVYSVSDLDPSICEMMGLERRWSLTGSLRDRWCRASAAALVGPSSSRIATSGSQGIVLRLGSSVHEGRGSEEAIDSALFDRTSQPKISTPSLSKEATATAASAGANARSRSSGRVKKVESPTPNEGKRIII